jgi:hypothetical protein
MRSHRCKLRTIMVGVAFLSLILTIIVQAIRLRSTAVELQRARARLARVDPETAWAQAIEDSNRIWSSPQNQRRWAAQMDYERHRMSLLHAPH